MTRSGLIGVAAAVLAAMCPGQALAQHVDVQVAVENGRLVTGRVDFTQPGNAIDPSWRVFEAAFGEFAGFTDDPGFNASSGSGLPQGTLLGFDILDAARKWSPANQNFETIPAETILVTFGGSSNATSPPECNGSTPGFWFASASASGTIHSHVGYFLNMPQSDGVYLLKLRLRTNNAGIAPSDPFWVVFSQNDLAARSAAAAYVRDVIEPDPCGSDFNGDGVVNGADLSVLLSMFGRCVFGGSAADANGDGMIDGADLSVLLSNFGRTC